MSAAPNSCADARSGEQRSSHQSAAIALRNAALLGPDVGHHRRAIPPDGGQAWCRARHIGNDRERRAAQTEPLGPCCVPKGRASAFMSSRLAGCEARWMGEGARIAEAAGAQIIDINMGCPAQKVTNGYAGSALMRDLDHALTLIEATVACGLGAGDAEDAARLGRPLDQCAGTRAPRRAGRRADDHRPWPHPLPVLQGPRRLGRGARRKGGGTNSRRRQRRHRRCSRGR